MRDAYVVGTLMSNFRAQIFEVVQHPRQSNIYTCKCILALAHCSNSHPVITQVPATRSYSHFPNLNTTASFFGGGGCKNNYYFCNHFKASLLYSCYLGRNVAWTPKYWQYKRLKVALLISKSIIVNLLLSQKLVFFENSGKLSKLQRAVSNNFFSLQNPRLKVKLYSVQ